MTKILKGKPVAKHIYNEIKKQLEKIEIKPKLVILIIGTDPAAEFYVSNLEKKGSKTGIEVTTKKFNDSIKQSELLSELESLNSDQNVHGIMIQKPLPKHIDENIINSAIDPTKDMDAFHPVNLGKMILDQDGFIPSTPAAVLQILKYYEIQTTGKEVVIIGRSEIVGKPLANLMLRKNSTGNATVTVCHSKTKNLQEITKNADILIAAIGKAEFVKKNMIKKDSIIIDVGVNQVKDPVKGYKYVGDVDYEDCFEKTLMITPVPGGVGTVTTAMLLENVLKSYKNKIK
ncbi:MAG: bifunctional 5,10-methylenetetrahydrofolate dehydrogenase/5,10-methenyltetrahydrofolate cyclohydrolase [Candidatus Cloacimonetes bacterium]|nr:bifunctional 5,10-methylenetetrahydrofolate dehydrogenase/5,10-methenyltetrahydrofolate cyclohydrolase [Candidatus Cloacimonadota bacterium]MCF7814600.1 bifunctional 5,10-methylenetetrahydrofolate dehydrogenase/5,10-methenyltetrahydrofolate cyclohydrolase [Candidatus Cloacimonadota bacterium]MCF7869080.1 bifunctional 5,10-methylenetetrahydrofolate dehydrogenase/5,10-methenyltetrahydrofolate cyclohydrolase [Candidatus Cloacimonadota bacterium]MCF7884497.1 bifunctional 5,10-methylenetetrahydrof